ncbi:hypothetical protein JKP88DRAFT_354175 [Tribonema minus]|uniref:Uncharacterized protein n=1 Tax=Tribonema minus TaxID=303371 RepID=A0A835Z103_9STRA|nr:hypothetical protein JKP88DRAFT_354175 [Tribonema minus]
MTHGAAVYVEGEEDEPVKNYMQMAQEYHVTAPYRDLKGRAKEARMVFFPCGHKCMCEKCVMQHKYSCAGATDAGEDSWTMCPVCAEQIKFMSLFIDGKTEVQRYWQWIDAVERTGGMYKSSLDVAAESWCCAVS